MERLVEGNCVMKHPVHSPHIGHVPIVERLVEGACERKHTGHSCHGHIPIIERLVKGACFTKHPCHIDTLRRAVQDYLAGGYRKKQI